MNNIFQKKIIIADWNTILISKGHIYIYEFPTLFKPWFLLLCLLGAARVVYKLSDVVEYVYERYSCEPGLFKTILDAFD